MAILDVRMQGMNGFQLWRKLREIDKTLKICFLTASDLTSLQDIDSDIINDLGTDYFIAKPVNTTDLINRLKGILSQEWEKTQRLSRLSYNNKMFKNNRVLPLLELMKPYNMMWCTLQGDAFVVLKIYCESPINAISL